MDELLRPLGAEPDPGSGRAVPRRVAVAHRWVVDAPAVAHEEVVAYYPETGGRDVSLVVEVPEQGHWETFLEDGSRPAFSGPTPPDDMSGLGEVRDSWEAAVWVPWTEAELEEMAAREAERARAQAGLAAREAMLLALPGEQAAQDDALCALYELAEAQREVIESQDDAICAVYEMMGV